MQLNLEAENILFILKKNAAAQAYSGLSCNNAKFINIRFNTEPQNGFNTH